MDLKKLYEYLCEIYDKKYIGLQGWSDGKVEGSSQIFIKAEINNLELFEKSCLEININKLLAVGFCINKLESPKRKEIHVKEFNHILIDLDGGRDKTNEYEKAKEFLNSMNIKYKYSDKSGNGFHFLIPIKMEKGEKLKIEQFLKYMKQETEIESLDTTVKLATQIVRIPGSIHRKGGEDYLTKLLEWNVITSHDIITNTEKIQTLIPNTIKIKDNHEVEIIGTGAERGDIFFTKILNSPELRKLIANKSGISKNDVLFKNLAIFTHKHPNYEDKVFDFVEECGHPSAEFEGWLNKAEKEGFNIINYNEMKGWILTHKLFDLQDTIQQQILIKGNFINKYEMCYLKNVKSQWRYFLLDKKTFSSNLHDERNFFKTILIEAQSINFDFMKYYSIYPFSDKGEPLSYSQKENKIINRIKETIEEMKLLKPIADFGYKPTSERYFEFGGETFINTYKKGPFEDWFEEKEVYNFTHIKKLLLHLVNNKEENYQYLINWISFILCNPTVKISTSIIFQGTQGIGKGRFREWIISKIWGTWNTRQINETHLEEKWGDFLINNRFVITNEIKIEGRNAKNKVKRIKEFSSDAELTVQLKGRDSANIQNYTHWLHFSDQDLPIPLEKADRRHTVFYNGEPLPLEIANILSPEQNPDYLEKELKDFVSYLKTLNVKFTDVDKPLINNEKNDLIEGSKSSVAFFIEELKNYDNIITFCKRWNHEFGVVDTENRFQNNTIISVPDLYDIYTWWTIKNHLPKKARRNMISDMKNEYELVSMMSRKIIPTREAFFELRDLLNTN